MRPRTGTSPLSLSLLPKSLMKDFASLLYEPPVSKAMGIKRLCLAVLWRRGAVDVSSRVASQSGQAPGARRGRRAGVNFESGQEEQYL
ncbi:hypothetical protein EVAR_25232_1 [Eumeta japonica]|uniref:Uncharacterized protein n=1 Tax=Eumeta variegata TaxID=151549 RepID=A0A4C1WK94_EUMVA|nr:hypothetical protein EVAR_25232_1 [Eumeta japonica]